MPFKLKLGVFDSKLNKNVLFCGFLEQNDAIQTIVLKLPWDSSSSAVEMLEN